MLEPGLSLSLETLWFQKCNQATERGSTYARISAENFITFKKRNFYADTEEPACERLLVLSFIRRPHSTDLPERTILKTSGLDSLYRSTTLNTTSTILAKKEASVLRKPPTPNPGENPSSPSKTHPASFSIPMLDRNSIDLSIRATLHPPLKSGTRHLYPNSNLRPKPPNT